MIITSRFWLPGFCALLGLLVLGGAALAGPNHPLGPGPLRPGGGPTAPAPGRPVPKGPGPAGAIAAVQESFESGTLSDFAAAVPTCVPGGCGWTAVMTYTHSGLYAAFAPDVANVADQQLVLTSSLALPAGATSAALSFWQRYGFETSGSSYYDGGVLEISTDQGASWADAGPNITAGGYNATISSLHQNPLAGRPAWGGDSGGVFQQVQVNLLPYKGQNLRFRLRLGTDTSTGGPGWWVDDVVVTYQAPLPCAGAGWSQPAPYPVPVAGAAVVGQGGALYSFGGLITTTGTVTITASAYKYDPAAAAWSALAPLPAARWGASAVSDGTYIYILNGGNPDNTSATNTLYRYNPATNTYTALTPASVATMLQAAAYLGGKIYRVAGATIPNTYPPTSSVEVYNVATNIWAPVVNYPQAVYGPLALAYGGYLYGGGGAAAGSVVTNKTYRYDPALNSWDDAAIADLPGPLYAGAGDFYNGRWLIAGGTPNGQSVVDGVVAWNPVANTWSSLTAMPQAEAVAGGAAVGGAFYTVGGILANAVQYSPNFQQYSEPACAVTPTPTPCPITFSDVQPSDYFYAAVRYLFCHGAISGYGDGTFRPYAATTRGQFSKIIVGASGWAINTSGGPHFSDVPASNPFYPFVETAFNRGVISGYADGTFRWGANVTRGQLSKIVVAAQGWAINTSGGPHFNDVPASNPFYPFVETAFNRGAISGYSDGTFRVGANATRGQISKIVYITLGSP